MSLNKTATPALPELRVYAPPECVNVEFRTMRTYIERMYERHYKLVWTEKNPQMEIYLTRYQNPTHIFPNPGRRRPFQIFWTAEPAHLNKTFSDHTFSFYHDTATNTWFPNMLNVYYEDFVTLLSNKPTQRVLTNRQTPKTNFCAFIQRYQNYNLTQLTVRNEFCAELMKYKKVLCPGRVMNNVPAPDYMKNHLSDYSKGLVRYLSECKFFICFENRLSSKQESDGLKFVTHKILSAFIAGSIPIYSGYREIAELFNPAAFINAHDFSSHKELIEYIKEVDNSPELTAAYQNATPILPDSPLHNLHPDKMRPLFLSLAEQATKPAIFQRYYLRRSYYVTYLNIGMKKHKLKKLIRRSVNFLSRKISR